MSSLNSSVSNLNGYTLYENTTGTQDDFTLSDSVANYKYIDVLIKEDPNYSFCCVFRFFVSPSGSCSYCNLTVIYNESSGALQARCMIYSFSGTSATMLRISRVDITASGNTISTSLPNIYITKVIGYK